MPEASAKAWVRMWCHTHSAASQGTGAVNVRNADMAMYSLVCYCVYS
jgi:hypothetical protein